MLSILSVTVVNSAGDLSFAVTIGLMWFPFARRSQSMRYVVGVRVLKFSELHILPTHKPVKLYICKQNLVLQSTLLTNFFKL